MAITGGFGFFLLSVVCILLLRPVHGEFEIVVANGLSREFTCLDDGYATLSFPSGAEVSHSVTRGRCFDGTSNSGNLTLFEYNSVVDGNYYDVSLVDGYSYDIRVVVRDRDVVTVACSRSIRPRPSDCYLYQRDEFCCKNTFNDADRCVGSLEYNRIFNACSNGAYLYAYDDTEGLHVTMESRIRVMLFESLYDAEAYAPFSEVSASVILTVSWIYILSLILVLHLFTSYCVFCSQSDCFI